MSHGNGSPRRPKVSKKNLLIIALSLGAGGLLTWWLWVRFHFLFVFVFIPILFAGSTLFRRLLTRDEDSDRSGG
jgi:hypothetical protein